MLLAALAGLWLSAVQAGRAPAVPAASPDVRISVFEPETELAELVDTTSKLLAIAIEYTPDDVQGKVMLRLPLPSSPAELLDTMHRALAARGLTTIQAPGSDALSVVKLAEAPALARLEGEGSPRAGLQKILIQLGNQRVDAAAEAIKLVLSKSGSVSPFKDARRIAVADFAPHVDQARRIAAEIERPLDERVVVEIPLVRTSPTSLTALVERVANAERAAFGDRGRGVLLAHPEGRSVILGSPVLELDRWRGLGEQFDRAEPAVTRNYSPRRFALTDLARLVEDTVHSAIPTEANEPWRQVVDGLSGTLIVTATPAWHVEIEQLLDRLERFAPTVQRPPRSFPVRHRSALELRDLLQGLLDAGALESPEPEPAAAPEPPKTNPAGTAPLVQGPTAPLAKQPPAPLVGGKLGQDVVISVDEPTNRLLVLASPRVHEQIGALLETLGAHAPGACRSDRRLAERVRARRVGRRAHEARDGRGRSGAGWRSRRKAKGARRSRCSGTSRSWVNSSGRARRAAAARSSTCSCGRA